MNLPVEMKDVHSIILLVTILQLTVLLNAVPRSYKRSHIQVWLRSFVHNGWLHIANSDIVSDIHRMKTWDILNFMV